MTSGDPIPLRTFDGFLKQHAHDALSAVEQHLFDALFPAFQGRPTGADSNARALEDAEAGSPAAFVRDALSDLIEVVPGEARPRRYAGYNLPRSRYFSVCRDTEGNDHQTLSHELRAYRDPVDVGMVEVIDLAQGCALSIEGASISLAPERATAVLIHEPTRLAPELRSLDFTRLPGIEEREILLYRFRYTVNRHEVPRTLDLRFADAREWFFETFRTPSDASDALVPSPGEDADATLVPTIARSRFHLENGVPPVPDDFWSMLPTLINPDLGGGSPADTGSTLVMVGHWMRQHDVNALVFPSARCDAAVVFENGVMKHWEGWNLLDFRNAPPFRGADAVTFVLSPWAWTSLPEAVRLQVPPEDSAVTGSFAIENMVDFWADDYLGQIRSLEIARSAHGREPSANERAADLRALAFRMFSIGTLCLRWLRAALRRAPNDDVQHDVDELQGIALPYDLAPLTGRVAELWSDMRRRPVNPGDMLTESMAVCDLVCAALRRRYPDRDIESLTRVGADIHWCLMFLGPLPDGGHTRSDSLADYIAGEAENAIRTPWLNAETRERTAAFFRRVSEVLRQGGGQPELVVQEGLELEATIYHELRGEPRSDHGNDDAGHWHTSRVTSAPMDPFELAVPSIRTHGEGVMSMRERFTDEEWTLIRHVPFDAFVFAALADKDVTEAEMAAFTETIEKAATLSDPLHREIAVDWAAAGAPAIGEEFIFELTESGQAMSDRLQRTKPMLKDKLTPDEYQSFVRSVTISGMAIAAASAKKKRLFHKQERIGPEEVEALAAFAVAFDVDMAAMQTLLQ